MKAKRIFTPARIVALVVIGVVVFGLTYVRFAPRRRFGLGAVRREGR